MANYTDRTSTLTGYGTVRAHHENTEYAYAEYVIRTEYGLVYAYVEIDSASPVHDYTEMEIIIGRRLYQRRWRRHWSRRTIIALAKRFAHDAVSDEIPF